VFPPDRAYLLVRGEPPARGGGFRTRNRGALVGSQNDLRLVVPGELQNETGDFILHGRRKATGGFNGAVEHVRS
jgi:hypothetical protein